MNKILVSQLYAQGIFIKRLAHLPEDIGIELYCETGNDLYWKYNLPIISNNWNRSVSVHGPFSWVNLADPNQDFKDIEICYQECFNFCKMVKAIHCVCHPDGAISGESNREECFNLALKRIKAINSMAKSNCINLLIENLPENNSMFNWQVFTDYLLKKTNYDFLLDAGHAIISGWNLPEYIRIAGDRLKALHVHEPMDGKDAHMPVGSGYYDWRELFSAVKKYCPDASIVLEYETATDAEMMNSLDYIRSLLS